MKTSLRRTGCPYSYVFRRRLKTSWLRPIYLSWSYVFKTSSRRFQDVFKTTSRRVYRDQYICLGHTSSRRLQDVFNTSSRHFQGIFKTSSRILAKMYSRRFQDVSLSYTVLVNMFSRYLQDVFTTFLRRTEKTFTLLHLPPTQLWEIMVSMQILQEWQQCLKF